MNGDADTGGGWGEMEWGVGLAALEGVRDECIEDDGCGGVDVAEVLVMESVRKKKKKR